MTLAPVSPFQREGADFNRPAAERVYKQLMGMDADSALIYGRMLVSAAVQNDLIVHGDQIAEVLTKVLGERTELLRKQLVRSSVSKARAGQDNTAELSALVELSKAGFFGSLFSPAARSQRAKEEKHNAATGRFEEVMHERIQTPSDAEEMPGRYADGLGIPKLPDVTRASMSSAQRAAYQHAYLQVERLLRPFAGLPKESGIVTFQYADGNPTWWEFDGGTKGKDRPKIPIIGTYTVEKEEEREVDGEKVKVTVKEEKASGPRGLDPTAKLEAVTLHVLPPANAKGGILTALNALGLPKLGAVASDSVEGGALDPKRVQDFGNTWNTKAVDDQFMPSNKLFRRLGAGSSLLEDSLGNAASPQVKMALKVSQHVGMLGPKATQILAPTLDRAAYRYRGTERSIDPDLLDAQQELSREVEQRASIQGRAKSESAAQREQAKAILENAKRRHDNRIKNARGAWDRAAAEHSAKAMSRKDFDRVSRQSRAELDQAQRDWSAAQKQYPLDLATADEREKAGAVSRAATNLGAARRGLSDKDNGAWKSGAVIDYFRHRVPDPNLNELQLASGVVPPSEGVILDGNGKILVQTVGYGDDHYLPFTLRNLSKLHGGYYIRTRVFGGPTSEDVYTALISGARGLTVVSNSGVFTLDFEHDLKGGRRFNDKAARMVARYGHLLDAVGSGQVPGAEIDPSRMREIYRDAANRAPGDQQAQRDYVKQTQERERLSPTLSGKQRDEAARQFLNDEFTDRGLGDTKAAGRRGGAMIGRRFGHSGLSLDEMVQVQATAATARHVARARAAGTPVSLANAESFRDEYARNLTSTPGGVAEALANDLSVGSGLQQALEAASDANRKNLSPLSLDGHGYDVAMQALKEQFPYYIHDTKYRPFDDGVDRTDTGYVKPKFNRPAAALAGYFDPSIGGTVKGGMSGKFTADSIRNQNGATLREVRPAGAPARDTAAGVAAGVAAGATATPAAVPVNARKVADRAMLDHLLTLQNFGPAFTAEALRGQPIRSNINDGSREGQDLQRIYGASEAEVRADQMRDPEGFRATMKRVVAWMNGFRASDELDQNIVDQFDKGEAAPAVRGITNPIIDLKDGFGRDHDFGNPIYLKSKSTTVEQVADAYSKDPNIKVFVAAGELPANPGDDGFPEAAKALRETILEEERAALAYDDDRAKAGPMPSVSAGQANARAYTLLAANQLHRRYKDAVSNHAEVQAPEPAAPPEKIIHERNEIIFINQKTGEQHAIEAPPGELGAGGAQFVTDLLSRMQQPPEHQGR